MQLPDIQPTLDQEQSKLLLELIQRDIASSQRQMRICPDQREQLRKRIIAGQAIRRQIPECYWR